MPTEFTFGAGDERISVRIEAAKASLNEGQTHKNRLESTINLNIGAFSGAFKAEFAIPDLVLLHEQLISSLSSLSETVVFKNQEEDLYLTIKFAGPGNASVNGTIKPHRMKQASLIVRLDVSHAALARTARELEDVFREFPPQRTSVPY